MVGVVLEIQYIPTVGGNGLGLMKYSPKQLVHWLIIMDGVANGVSSYFLLLSMSVFYLSMPIMDYKYLTLVL